MQEATTATTEKPKREKRPRPPLDVNSNRRLLDTDKTCQFLSISRDTLDRLYDDPEEKFPVAIPLRGGKRSWTLRSLEEYVDRKERTARAEDKR